MPDKSTSHIENFLHVYSTLNADNLALLDTVYASDILFTDPAHTIAGLPALRNYFSGLYKNVSHISFGFEDCMAVGHEAYIRWDMLFSHPRLNGNKNITVAGVTFLIFDEAWLVTRHRDYFDLGAMLYEHVPLLGRVISTLKKRLAS